MWVEVRRECKIEEQMCAVLWLCARTDGDQVQPLSPQHLSPLAPIQLPRATPPLPAPHLPLLLGGEAEACMYVCVYVGRGCLGLEEEAGAVPSAHPSSLTGDCWRSQLASSWPIRSIWCKRRKESLVNVRISCCCLCFKVFCSSITYTNEWHRKTI